ncbi:MAG: hypothetical protein U0575_03200 [Phycisphaerales bacterium]
MPLGENFRSTPPHHRGGGAGLIGHNRRRKAKALHLARRRPSGRTALLLRDERHEAEAVLERLRRWSDAGVRGAVSRAHRMNAASRVLEDALRTAACPT